LDEEELDEDEDELEEEELEDESGRKVVLELDRLGREVELDGWERNGVLVLVARDGAMRYAGRRVV
jgi:hypothetical protein